MIFLGMTGFMINAIVQDWPAEVPNPYTLLTNVSPNAIFFTVIDLCCAFFSFPLADETIAISPSHLEGVSKAQFPKTIEEIMIFLGMTGFSVDWIGD